MNCDRRVTQLAFEEGIRNKKKYVFDDQWIDPEKFHTILLQTKILKNHGVSCPNGILKVNNHITIHPIKKARPRGKKNATNHFSSKPWKINYPIQQENFLLLSEVCMSRWHFTNWIILMWIFTHHFDASLPPHGVLSLNVFALLHYLCHYWQAHVLDSEVDT